MKQEILELPKNPEHRAAAIETATNKLVDLDLDNCYEVVIRNQTVGKTLRQLRGHFGHILKAVSDYTGEDVDYLHRHMKAKFLAKIYVAGPIGPLQDQWAELLAVYLASGERVREGRDKRGEPYSTKFEVQAKRISLEWVTKNQMILYVDQVLAYYQNEGVPVSAPDRNRDKRAAA